MRKINSKLYDKLQEIDLKRHRGNGGNENLAYQIFIIEKIDKDMEIKYADC